MKKRVFRVLVCIMLSSLLLCGCGDKKSGKKLEEVSAETLISNMKIDSKSLDLTYNVDVDTEVNLGFSDENMPIIFKGEGNMKSDEDCIYAKLKANQTLGKETDSYETQEYYVTNGDECMNYYTEDGSIWYAISSSPVDINGMVSYVRPDILKDVKVETKADEYVLTGKLDIIKAVELAGDAVSLEESEIETFKNVIINITMKFDADKNVKYLAISVDGSTIPENESLVVRKCDIALTINATSGVSVECPQDIIDNAKTYN